MPNTATITFCAVELEVDVVDLAQQRRQLVAAGGDAAHVDREAQRVVGEHARAAREALVEHVQALDLADLLARARRARPSCARSSSRPCTAAWRRAASSEPNSSELGLVDSVSVTARSTTSSPISSPRRGRGAASPTG